MSPLPAPTPQRPSSGEAASPADAAASSDAAAPPAGPALTRCCVDEAQDHQTLLSIREVVAAYSTYWHKLIVEITVFILTACIVLAGYAISRDTSSASTSFGICILVIILGRLGVKICDIILEQVCIHRDILVKLDKKHSLFTDDIYIKGKSIYPIEWKESGESGREPIATLCMDAQCIVTLILVIIVLADYMLKSG